MITDIRRNFHNLSLYIVSKFMGTKLSKDGGVFNPEIVYAREGKENLFQISEAEL